MNGSKTTQLSLVGHMTVIWQMYPIGKKQHMLVKYVLKHGC